MSTRYSKWAWFSIRMETDSDTPPAGTVATKTGELPPLRPNRTFESEKDVQEEMAEIDAKAGIYVQRAKEQNRSLNDAERATVRQYGEYYRFLEQEELPLAKEFDQRKHDALMRQFGERGERDHRMLDQESMAGYGTLRRAQPGVPNIITPQLQCFTPEIFGDRHEAGRAANEAGHWLRAMLTRNPESIKFCQDRPHLAMDNFDERFLQQEGVDADGGYLVPDIVRGPVIDVRNRVSLIAGVARNYPMAGEKDLVPKRLTGLTVYKPGEDTAITESNKTYGQVALTTTDAYTLTPISHKLMRGSVVNVADQVVSEIGYSFAAQQDYEGINGDGTAGSPNFGITGAVTGISAASKTTATGATTYATITAAHLRTLMGLLPDRFHGRNNTGAMGSMFVNPDEAVFVCSRAVHAETFLRLQEDAGGNTKMSIAGQDFYAYNGYRILFTEEMPSTYGATQTCILFGNFRHGMILGEREGVGIASSEHNKFEFNQLVIRGMISYDIQFHETGDGSNAGSIVGLVTPV